MSEMEERVARAICELDGIEWDGSLGGREVSRNRYRGFARAAIAATRWNERMNPWQPIETAPKDGSKVDLMFPGVRGRTINCFWREDEITGTPGNWFWSSPKWGRSGELLPENEWLLSCYLASKPTHWMQPPPPPTLSLSPPGRSTE